jgi:GalNAc-alpha-(1->4)-GalNAc-alpha-(1->3)-diNAcBac-PP-undecaprenol alpha-1,4-N-acetyl-D-galactosaminyltransferase
MKKICLVIPDLSKGGMERVMSELANFFCNYSDTSVKIILLTNRSAVFYKIKPEIDIIRPKFTFRNKWRLFYTLRTLFYLRRKIKEMQPDSVLSFGETYNSFVLLSLLFLRINVFVSDRSKPDKRWGVVQESLRRMLYPKAKGIISQTRYSRDYLLRETGHQNIQVIPNPVKSNDIVPKERQNVILNVGRIIQSKRLDLLFNIFSNTVGEGWELWLVGDDEAEEKNNLLELARQLNIFDKVRFWGKQEDIDNFYLSASIFAFTSESEGMPNVLLEAMAAGCACISFDCVAGPSDIIDDGINGYLVDLYDLDNYTLKLNKLISDPQLRKLFSEKAMSRAKDFHIDIIGDKYYNAIMNP